MVIKHHPFYLKIAELTLSYKAQAPGSLMLVGEYAVLVGYPAIVLAINRFITVNLEPRSDRVVNLFSVLGEHTTDLETLTIMQPFEYVLATLAAKISALPSGCDIHIHSEFDSGIGLGSSAAVTIATLQALYQWIRPGLATSVTLWHEAIDIIHQVQGGHGSGADLAASLYGGILSFQQNPFKIRPLSPAPPITVVYTGKNNMRTPQAIQAFKRDYHREKHDRLLQKIGQLAPTAAYAISQGNWHKLGALLAQGQGYMRALGVSTPKLNRIVHSLSTQPDIFGAKLSGSGLGDCIIGIGVLKAPFFPQTATKHSDPRLLPLSVSWQGSA